MAVPTSFAESNTVLGRPGDMTDEQCSCLSVLRTHGDDGMPWVISCWKLTAEELAEINRTGRVWLVVAGQTMPPAFVAGEKFFAPEATAPGAS